MISPDPSLLPTGLPHDPLIRPSFREACRLWLKIGCLSFGGPAAQISLMHEELVEHRRWVDDQRFQHALQFCVLLPGPEAQQLATYLGWWLHGTRGGVVAGTLFVLPAAALLLILSWGYAIWGAVPWVSAALQGVQPAVVALMGAAVIRLSQRWLRSRWHWVMTLGTWIGIHQGWPFPLLLLLVFLAGILWRRLMPEAVPSIPAEDLRQSVEHSGAPFSTMRSSVRVFLVCVALWWLPVLLAAFAFGVRHVLVQEGIFFSGASVVTIGGAYAVLPYVAQQGVERFHWVSGSEMMAGMALAEATPGPLIIVLQFIGFLGAWHHPGSLSPIVAGILGAGITSWTTFFPSFLWIFVGAPWVERLQGLKSWGKWMGVVSAGVVGMILNLAWKLGAATVVTVQGSWDGVSLVILALTFSLLRWGRWPGVAVVALAALMGVLRPILRL